MCSVGNLTSVAGRGITEWLRLEYPSENHLIQLLGKSSQQELVAQDCVQAAFDDLHKEYPQPLWAACVSAQSPAQKNLTDAEGAFCVPAYTYCLFSCHWTPLEKKA